KFYRCGTLPYCPFLVLSLAAKDRLLMEFHGDFRNESRIFVILGGFIPPIYETPNESSLDSKVTMERKPIIKP
ncbi:hypothetical protein N3553_25305, partial [Pantoea dispersa]|nr:hypothetical protein [Pantoea dispersa]